MKKVCYGECVKQMNVTPKDLTRIKKINKKTD